MAFPFSNVIVIGSTGNVGPSIIDNLFLNAEYFKQITAVTSSNVDDPKFANIKSRGVKVVQVDLDDKQSLVNAFKGYDVIISVIGVPGFLKQILFIDAAVEAGVKHFVPSEFGADIFDPTVLNVGVLDPKRKVEEHLFAYAKQGNITYTIFNTGVFFDWALKTGFIDFDLKTQEVVLYNEGKHPFVSTNVEEIGKFVVAALKRPDLSINKQLRLGTLFVSQQEILQSLEKATGKKWTIKGHSTTEEAKKRASEFLAKGDIRGFVQNSILSHIYSGEHQYPLDDNKLFPDVKLLTLDQSVELVVKSL